MGDHQEKGLFRGFLYHLEESVRASGIHFLGKIHQYAPPPSLNSGKGEGAYGATRFSDSDYKLLVPTGHNLNKLILKEIGIIEDKFSPLWQPVLGHGGLGSRILSRIDGREYEADVRMDHLGDFVAVRTDSAGITFMAVPAIQILKEREREGYASAAVILMKEDSVRNAA
jgi:hypothetical protein